MKISITKFFGLTNLTRLANRKIEWIVFHYTAGTTSKKGSAINLASGYKNGSLAASSDYVIDDATVVQYNQDIKNRYSWGVGGKKYPSMSTSLGGQFYGKCTNANCINIEVCSNKTNRKSLQATDTDWYFTESELSLAAQLIAHLMKTYNIDINHVIMHHQVTGKLCPAMWTQKESQLVNWRNFIAKVKTYAGEVDTNTDTTVQTYEVVKDIRGYISAADAMAGTNAKTTVTAGKYYIYKTSNGAKNISKTAGTAGSWINPADNVKEDKETTITEPTETKHEYPQIEIGKTIIKVKSVAKSGSKKVNGNNTFTYGDFACSGDDTMVVSKSLPVALEKLMEFMNLSKIRIMRGYEGTVQNTSVAYNCNLHSRHANGYAADIICYDKSGVAILSKYICCAAQLLGFPGIAMCLTPAGVMTHLDVRSNSLWCVESKSDLDIRKLGYKDFFDYFSMKESDLNRYTGLDIGVEEEKDERVKIDEETPTTTIMGKIKAPKERLVAYIKSQNPNFDTAIADAYYTIGEIYGVRGDIALCQSMLETGYFKFDGSAVTADQHNYCGLGVTSNGVKGCAFDTIENGVEAQIQHLYAYGSKDAIPENRTLYDPRFAYVTRGIAPNWGSLNMKWAMTNIYGQTIISIYNSAIK